MKKSRKNYLPTLILVLVLWSLFFGMIFYVEPELVKNVLVDGLYLPFFLLFIPACFYLGVGIRKYKKRLYVFTLALVLGNTRRGF